MATEKDFRVKSSIVAPTSLQVGSATITSSGSAVVLPANSTIDDGAGGSVNIGSPDLTGYATESYVTAALTSYATTAQLSTKANSADLSTVALTGNYNDLSNKPTIPSLTGYATETYVNNAVANVGANANVFYENSTTLNENYTITSGSNAMSAGPIDINTGITVNIPSGSVWTIV